MVWGSKGVHATWFSGDPEFVHGINFLPITSGSLYLGRHPDYIIENYNEIVEEKWAAKIMERLILVVFINVRSKPSFSVLSYRVSKARL